MKTYLSGELLVIMVGALAGCHSFVIDSDPPGAEVYIDGQFLGVTPFSHTWVFGQKATGFLAETVLPGFKRTDCPQLPRNPYQPETFFTNAPEGAKYYVDGLYVGTGPTFYQLNFPKLIKAVWTKEALAKAGYSSTETPSAQKTPAATARPKRTTPSSIAGNRFALVIGLSDYKYRGKWRLANLRYAGRDAAQLADYLGRPDGGRFDDVTLLMDEKATTSGIRIALKEKLRGVQESDLVLIFWAGHGSPDPHEQDKLYLITHDTDPEHMASTAYSMKEFREDVANLKARQVIVIADTCYSAGIGDPSMGIRGVGDNKIVEGIRGVYVAPDPEEPSLSMRFVFTSCEQGEVSRESSKLGGGHGVFTWFLLQAMEGEADKTAHGGNSDGKVTLGEVIEYTRDQVKRFTGNQQHPDTAGQFDRGLPMGATK